MIIKGPGIIFFPLSCLTDRKDQVNVLFPKALRQSPLCKSLSVLEFRLNTSTKSFAKASELLKSLSGSTFQNPVTVQKNVHTSKVAATEMFALLNFGRSGTGLLHGLIDNHPQVSTLPSYMFSEFFDPIIWNSQPATAGRELPTILLIYILFFSTLSRRLR